MGNGPEDIKQRHLMATSEEFRKLASQHQRYEEFRKLASQHQRYDEQLQQLAAKPCLSEQERIQEVRLKKLKLRLKDEMERIIQHYKKEHASTMDKGIADQAPSVVVTSAAEKYAKSLRLRDSLLLAQRIVRQTFPSLKAVYLDAMNDPEEGGYPTICFLVTVSETVRQTLELDESLQDALYHQIPAAHRMYLSFRYKFE